MLVCFVSVSCCLFSLFFVFLEVRYGLPLGAPWFSKAQGRAKRDVARMFERIGRGLARGGLVRGGLANPILTYLRQLILLDPPGGIGFCFIINPFKPKEGGLKPC